MVGLHWCRSSVLRTGPLLPQQPGQTHHGGGDSERGWVAPAIAGPPHHHDLYGLTPQQFDAILSVAEPNPVPRLDRWKPS
jgi:hypothetical protein